MQLGEQGLPPQKVPFGDTDYGKPAILRNKDKNSLYPHFLSGVAHAEEPAFSRRGVASLALRAAGRQEPAQPAVTPAPDVPPFLVRAGRVTRGRSRSGACELPAFPLKPEPYACPCFSAQGGLWARVLTEPPGARPVSVVTSLAKVFRQSDGTSRQTLQGRGKAPFPLPAAALPDSPEGAPRQASGPTPPASSHSRDRVCSGGLRCRAGEEVGAAVLANLQRFASLRAQSNVAQM